MQLSVADMVWNRAALKAGGAVPFEGDKALAALLAVHGMIMNGGVGHALEVLDPVDWAAGIDGFRYFDLVEVAAVLEAAAVADVGFEVIDAKYGALIPDDAALVRAFKERYVASPDAFAPLGHANA